MMASDLQRGLPRTAVGRGRPWAVDGHGPWTAVDIIIEVSFFYLEAICSTVDHVELLFTG